MPGAYRARQTAVVRSRLRVLAPAIAVLTLAWIPVDVFGLAAGELRWVLPLRLSLALALVLLSRAGRHLSSPVAVASFVWLQAVAFGAMAHSLMPTGGPLHDAYRMFPFVIAAQLAVFPLPWGRGTAVALAPVALLLAPLLTGDARDGASMWSDAWLLGLILMLAISAGHMQLRLLVDLLGAQRDASCDALTGLANRRTAEHRLRVEQARAERRREPLTVAMLDLDHFKQVNDRWGHAAGDRVLVATAQVLREELRGADLGVRFGGEEFLAVLPGTGGDSAIHVAERIRERVGRFEVPADDGMIRVTVSIGLATLLPGESLPALLARADAALYRAKAEGRDRCVLADDSVSAGRTGPATDA